MIIFLRKYFNFNLKFLKNNKIPKKCNICKLCDYS